MITPKNVGLPAQPTAEILDLDALEASLQVEHEQTLPSLDEVRRANIDAAMAMLGYQPGFPPGAAAVEAIDTAICAELECPCCWRVGMICLPYHRPRGYRVVGLCPECGSTTEL